MSESKNECELRDAEESFSWATFEIELPPGDGPLKWNARFERKEDMDFFEEKLQETFQEFEDEATGN